MSNKANVTIQSSKVDSDLSNYPIYIDLSDLPSGFWNTVSNGGADIRAYKDDGSTQLPVEVVSCNTTTDTGEIHVKYTGTLSSSNDTTIQIWADGSSSEPASDSTYGSENVWDSDYVLISHDGGLSDSTGNGNGGSNSGTSEKSDAKIGSGRGFSEGDTISLGNGSFFTGESQVTIQLWAYTDSIPDSYSTYLGAFEGWDDYMILGINSNNNWWFLVEENANSCNIAAGTPAIDSWNKLTGVFNNGNSELFVNGNSIGTDTGGTSTFPSFNPNYLIGELSGNNNHQYLVGYTDEVRIINTELSSTWISTEYNNQSSPSTFYTASEPVTENTTNFFNFF